MVQHQSQTLPHKKRAPNKLIAGFAALAATAVITASGFAAASPAVNQPGSGYGGGNTSVATNINLNVNNSNNNIFTIIVNIFR